jgi:AcrR family transcriptional regulator
MATADEARARRGRPGYDQETVLRRAIELFNSQGYDATSIGDLAADLGLTKSAIYHHVPSKESLLSAALDEALDSLSAAIDAAVSLGGSSGGSSSGTAAEQLRHAIEGSVRALVAHQPAVTLLLRVRGNSPVELAALQRRRALDDRLAALVAAAAQEGAVRDDIAPDLISRLLFGMVNSLTEWYRPGGPVDADHLAQSLAALAFDGLRRR